MLHGGLRKWLFYASGRLGYNARLGRGLVFNDDIAARHRIRIRRNLGSGRAGNLGEASGQSRRREGLSGAGLGKRTERMWEPDRGQASKRDQRGKGEPWRIKKDKVSVSFCIRSLISHRTCTAPTHPLHSRIR